MKELKSHRPDRLSRIVLRVTRPDELAEFYRRHLGMKIYQEDGGLLLNYDNECAGLQLLPAEDGLTYAPGRHDRYWKIGITLPNVDIACQQLRVAGFDVSEPRQFLDIGYMCHLCDPEGFAIELLQHQFKATRPANAGNPELPLGGGGRIGQITLRTNNIDKDLAFYRDRVGLRLLSIQPVHSRGFTLYFLAASDEQPPDEGLEAVGNREWLWQRPYTTLEFQAFDDADVTIVTPQTTGAGYHGLELQGASADELVDDVGSPVKICH